MVITDYTLNSMLQLKRNNYPLKVNPQREFKLKLIKSLSDLGWDTKRISDYLNSNNFKHLWFEMDTKIIYINRQKY